MNFLEKYIYKKLKSSQISDLNSDVWQHVRKEQLKQVDKITNRSMLYAALAGAFAVLLCYLPYHVFGHHLFPETAIWIPIYDDYVQVEISFLAYSLILLILEIVFLTYNNINTVRKIALSCQFPKTSDPFYEFNIKALIAVGLEKKIKDQQTIGIDPYTGLSKWRIFLYSALNLAKAAMTNFAFKILLRRVLGRYAIRILVDLAGMPIYAFWNAYAAKKVARSAKSRILANPLIYKFSEDLYEDQKNNEAFKKELYHLLEYIAITKRAYNINHYLLALELLRKFQIPINPNHIYDKSTLDRIAQASQQTKEGFSKLMLVGLALDGKISERDLLHIYNWRKSNCYLYSISDSRNYAKAFYSGNVELPMIEI